MSRARNKQNGKNIPKSTLMTLGEMSRAANTSGSTYYARYDNADYSGVSSQGTTTIPPINYPSTAQPQRLVDFRARVEIDEVKNKLAQQAALFQRMEDTVTTLETRLDRFEGAANKSISETVAHFLHNVKDARATYIEPTSDGYRVIVTYPSSMRLVDFLEEAVPAEIEIDRRYKEVYFDFTHLPEDKFSLSSFPNAKVVSYRERE